MDESRVVKWAEERNLIKGSNPESQMLKLMEEKSAGKKEENNDKNKENGTDNDN